MGKTIDPVASADKPRRGKFAPPDGVHRFGAAALIAAITFHLVDEGLAAGVSADSAGRAERRIAATVATGGPLEIDRGAWRRMSNGERLTWLLVRSETSYQLRDDNLAVLERRGE